MVISGFSINAEGAKLQAISFNQMTKKIKQLCENLWIAPLI